MKINFQTSAFWHSLKKAPLIYFSTSPLPLAIVHRLLTTFIVRAIKVKFKLLRYIRTQRYFVLPPILALSDAIKRDSIKRKSIKVLWAGGIADTRNWNYFLWSKSMLGKVLAYLFHRFSCLRLRCLSSEKLSQLKGFEGTIDNYVRSRAFIHWMIQRVEKWPKAKLYQSGLGHVPGTSTFGW